MTMTLKVNAHEFEAMYRILITTTCDSIGEQRNLNDVLEAFEGARPHPPHRLYRQGGE